MKKTARFAALLALSVAGSGVSFATTVTLASYGSTSSAPSGVDNTAVTYSGGATYNIPTGGIWSAPTGSSSWVSYDPMSYPGGGSHPVNGVYNYSSTFFDDSGSTSSGSITVMADDTTSVSLNGVLITAAAGANPAQHCTVTTPNCTVPATYTLTGFVDGINTLTFAVNQDFNDASGLDFSGYVNTSATPEPGSLMLLGSGLLGVGGQLYRRRRMA